MQAEDDLDDILGGSDDVGFNDEVDDSDEDDESREEEAGSSGDFTGSIAIASSYNYKDHEVVIGDKTTDYKGLSKLRTQLNLKIRW